MRFRAGSLTRRRIQVAGAQARWQLVGKCPRDRLARWETCGKLVNTIYGEELGMRILPSAVGERAEKMSEALVGSGHKT